MEKESGKQERKIVIENPVRMEEWNSGEAT